MKYHQMSIMAFCVVCPCPVGPPSEAAGLFGEVTGDYSVILSWTAGDSHGAEILFFNIEYQTNFNPIWRYKYTREWTRGG